jgi:uncharacterized Zn finger protein
MLRRRVFVAQEELPQHPARHHHTAYPPRPPKDRQPPPRPRPSAAPASGASNGRQPPPSERGRKPNPEQPRAAAAAATAPQSARSHNNHNNKQPPQPPAKSKPSSPPPAAKGGRASPPPKGSAPTPRGAADKDANGAARAKPHARPQQPRAASSAPSSPSTVGQTITAPNGGNLPAVNPDQPSAHATTWWGRHWIDAIERISTTYANRLVRGLKYAQQHRVRNLKVAPGKIELQIAGQRRAPYRVNIQLKVLTAGQWNKIVEVLSGRAAFTASLLAGELPESLSEVFDQCGMPLFPNRMNDIKASCSCPDWANPCKHVAAAYIAVAEALDADPFLLLSVRGRNQEQLLSDLRTARSGEEIDDDALDGHKDLGGVSIGQLDASNFFNAQDDLSDYRFHISRPEIPMPLLRRLGDPNHWRAPQPLAQLLSGIYDKLSELAARIGSIELAEPDLDDDLDDDPALNAGPGQSSFHGRPSTSPAVAHAPSPSTAPAAHAPSVAVASASVSLTPQAVTPDNLDPAADPAPKVLVRRAARAAPAGRTSRKSAPKPPPSALQPALPASPDQPSAPADAQASAASPPKPTPAPKPTPKPPQPQPAATASTPSLTASAQAEDDASPRRLPRRVAPGSAEATDSASVLEARLAMILPITETDDTPNGPAVARQIIWALRTHGAATARQLARRTRLKKTSVVQILQALLTVGLVSQDGQGERARFAVLEDC